MIEFRGVSKWFGSLHVLKDTNLLVKAGEVITPYLLRAKMLVRRGELVTLYVEGRGFRITTQGQASEDARRGDPVRVTNLASKREVFGKVEGPGVVRVSFGDSLTGEARNPR